MSDAAFDLERIKAVLREATAPGARFSQRGLGIKAGGTRDTIGDILNGRNLNPTTKILGGIAEQLGGDLSMFGLAAEKTELPTEDDLREALIEVLPDMPKGAPDRRARWLAVVLAERLRLPRSLDESDVDADGAPIHASKVHARGATPSA